MANCLDQARENGKLSGPSSRKWQIVWTRLTKKDKFSGPSSRKRCGVWIDATIPLVTGNSFFFFFYFLHRWPRSFQVDAIIYAHNPVSSECDTPSTNHSLPSSHPLLTLINNNEKEKDGSNTNNHYCKQVTGSIAFPSSEQQTNQDNGGHESDANRRR